MSFDLTIRWISLKNDKDVLWKPTEMVFSENSENLQPLSKKPKTLIEETKNSGGITEEILINFLSTFSEKS